MAYHISTTLKVPLALQKMHAVANSQSLLKVGQNHLGLLAGTGEWAPGNLGVPFSVGKHLRVPSLKAIKKRFAKFQHRGRRLGALRVSRRANARLFKSGILSTVSYGME
eukprot:8723316-Pyramimonas_sp.AAC.1